MDLGAGRGWKLFLSPPREAQGPHRCFPEVSSLEDPVHQNRQGPHPTCPDQTLWRRVLGIVRYTGPQWGSAVRQVRGWSHALLSPAAGA